MRVRLIRPSYWTDADLQTRLRAEVREFYIGLWMEADDAGYVAWDVDRVGADLYPFRPLSWRRAHLPEYLESLKPHARLLSCGEHVVIPSLPQHQTPPKPSYQNQRAHDACMRRQPPADPTGDHMAADGTRQEGGSFGGLSEGGSRRDGLKEKLGEFADMVASGQGAR